MTIPFLTSDLPALGGEIKTTAEDFIVEEVPSYSPSGQGQHIYLTLRRQNMNTDEVIKTLRHLFSIPEKEIGKAGLKDKNATTTQTFSLSLGANFPLENVRAILAQESRLEVISIERHLNKLKTGHLKGNNFKIVIQGISHNPEVIDAIAKRIIQGLPNFYGEQRFGSKGDNAATGLRILRGEKTMNHHMQKLMLSALQSELFNYYLIKRISHGALYQRFDEDVTIYQEVTGPLFGEKMLTPSGTPLLWEEETLQENQLKREELVHELLPGGRRPILVLPENLTYKLSDERLELSFFLPKGSYATIVTREFTKT